MCVSAPHPVPRLEGKHILGGNFSLSKALKNCPSHLETAAVMEKREYGVKDSFSSRITCGEAANLTSRAPPRNTPRVLPAPKGVPYGAAGRPLQAGRQPRSQPLRVALQPP